MKHDLMQSTQFHLTALLQSFFVNKQEQEREKENDCRCLP